MTSFQWPENTSHKKQEMRDYEAARMDEKKHRHAEPRREPAG
jgi:hypothetical protein